MLCQNYKPNLFQDTIAWMTKHSVANYILCDYKREGIGEQLTKIKKVDVMHIHASNPYLKLLYVIVGKLCGTQSLITLHGKYGIYGKWKNHIHKLALKWSGYSWRTKRKIL